MVLAGENWFEPGDRDLLGGDIIGLFNDVLKGDGNCPSFSSGITWEYSG